MSDAQQKTMEEMLAAAVAAVSSQQQPVQQQMVAPMPAAQLVPQQGMMGMGMQPAAQMGGAQVQPTGILINIRIPMPDGSEVPAYLQLPQEALANPGAIPQIVQALAQTWPVKFWQNNRNQNNWGNRGGGGYNNNYRQNNGGYNNNNRGRW